jgi:hypothetical protein
MVLYSLIMFGEYGYTMVAAMHISPPIRKDAKLQSVVVWQTAACWPDVCNRPRLPHPILGVTEKGEQPVVCLVDLYKVDQADTYKCWRESSGVSVGSCRPSENGLEYQCSGRVRHRCCCGSEKG